MRCRPNALRQVHELLPQLFAAVGRGIVAAVHPGFTHDLPAVMQADDDAGRPLQRQALCHGRVFADLDFLRQCQHGRVAHRVPGEAGQSAAVVDQACGHGKGHRELGSQRVARRFVFELGRQAVGADINTGNVCRRGQWAPAGDLVNRVQRTVVVAAA